MPDSTIYVNYCDAINDSKVKAMMAFLADLIFQKHPESIYLLFSSSGGQVEAGISLYNYLKALPLTLVTHNTGNIDSIANVIFLAGQTRFASVHSSFMFHGVNWNFVAASSLNRSQVSESLSGIEASEAKILGVLTERSKLNAEEVRTLFAKGETKDPAWAQTKGLISAVKDAAIPPGAILLSPNFN
jgi:ATP-dependent protease ClpP protease subunit